LSTKEAGVIVIDSDNDDNGSGKTSGETGGEASGEDDTALDFNAFDYWCH
jgi:hypothetical protein